MSDVSSEVSAARPRCGACGACLAYPQARIGDTPGQNRDFGRSEGTCAAQRGGRRPVPTHHGRRPPRCGVGWGVWAAVAAVRRKGGGGLGYHQYLLRVMPPRITLHFCVFCCVFVCILLCFSVLLRVFMFKHTRGTPGVRVARGARVTPGAVWQFSCQPHVVGEGNPMVKKCHTKQQGARSARAPRARAHTSLSQI